DRVCLAGHPVPLEGEQSAADRRNRGHRSDRLSDPATGLGDGTLANHGSGRSSDFRRCPTRLRRQEAGTQRRMNMWTRSISQAPFWLAITLIVSPASALTQNELIAKLQAAGYSQVSDIK